MLNISAAAVDKLMTWPELVDALDSAFRNGMIQPVRHHHPVERPEGTPSMLLLMPAWSDFHKLSDPSQGYMGVKIVTVSPDNGLINKPAVMGVYLLLDGITGEPKALIDGQSLTRWRTAAASALAARYLAREDASRLVIMGAGAVSTNLARAHSAVRPITDIALCVRNPQRAEATIKELRDEGYNAYIAEDHIAAIEQADIVAAGTLATKPVIHGKHLRPGTHIDLVGAFTPDMRESDDEAVLRSRVFVDTKAGALQEGGDITQPLRDGIIQPEHVLGDLFDLARGTVQGRISDQDITLFKYVGAAMEDLAAGIMVYEKSLKQQG